MIRRHHFQLPALPVISGVLLTVDENAAIQYLFEEMEFPRQCKCCQ